MQSHAYRKRGQHNKLTLSSLEEEKTNFNWRFFSLFFCLQTSSDVYKRITYSELHSFNRQQEGEKKKGEKMMIYQEGEREKVTKGGA